MQLVNTTFGSGVAATSFELVTDIPSISISQVSGGASGSATSTLTLAFTGDFSAPETLAVRVKAAAHNRASDLTTAALTIDPQGLVDTAPTFGTTTVPALYFRDGVAIAPVQLPAASGGNGALSYAVSGGQLFGLKFDATGTDAGGCTASDFPPSTAPSWATAPRTLCGTPTGAGSSGTAILRVQDADSNPDPHRPERPSLRCQHIRRLDCIHRPQGADRHQPARRHRWRAASQRRVRQRRYRRELRTGHRCSRRLHLGAVWRCRGHRQRHPDAVVHRRFQRHLYARGEGVVRRPQPCRRPHHQRRCRRPHRHRAGLSVRRRQELPPQRRHRAVPDPGRRRRQRRRQLRHRGLPAGLKFDLTGTDASGCTASDFPAGTAASWATEPRTICGTPTSDAESVVVFSATDEDGDVGRLIFRVTVAGPAAALGDTVPATLTEANLDGATVTVALARTSFTSGVTKASFELITTIPGIEISSISTVAVGDTQATLTLAFTGDFSGAHTIAVKVSAAAHLEAGDLTTGTLSVAATPLGDDRGDEPGDACGVESGRRHADGDAGGHQLRQRRDGVELRADDRRAGPDHRLGDGVARRRHVDADAGLHRRELRRGQFAEGDGGGRQRTRSTAI